MAAAWFLHLHHDITLFEKNNRIGGHSNTVDANEAGRAVPIDTGFMVYNEVTYPLLTKLFAALEVETKATSMSFSVQHIPAGIEFNGGSVNQLFGARKNLWNLRFWKMLLQIKRFNAETIAELEAPQWPDVSLEEYVALRGYGTDFLDWYLSPMAAAVWSSPPEKIRKFPARTLMRFWHNHGFLGLHTQHPWRTLCGGSRQYVEKLTRPFASNIRRGHAVVGARRVESGQQELLFEDGSTAHFDRVVFASHADQSLSLLDDASELEKNLLAKFYYQKNLAVLHSDDRFMPRVPRCRAAWNYRIDQGGDGKLRYSTHYWMNQLQHVSKERNYYVTINPAVMPDEASIHCTLDYEHPLFDLHSIAAQQRIGELHQAGASSGRYYCGAWQRYGFHEDGLLSAVNVCREILQKDPWP